MTDHTIDVSALEKGRFIITLKNFRTVVALLLALHLVIIGGSTGIYPRP